MEWFVWAYLAVGLVCFVVATERFMPELRSDWLVGVTTVVFWPLVLFVVVVVWLVVTIMLGDTRRLHQVPEDRQ